MTSTDHTPVQTHNPDQHNADQANADLEPECDVANGCDAIKLIITPRATDLGEFSVRRTLPNRQCKTVGPWIFFDHMGPAEFAAGSGINVRPHPHINLATVTYLFEGEILHRDSVGSLQTITPGDINLMVAGSGIVHSERERPEVKQQPHRLHGLQLWLALPIEFEEIAKILEMNESAIRVALSRARKTIRDYMTETHKYGIS